MATKQEIEEWAKTLSNNMGHRDRVIEFCKRCPGWDPIRGVWA